MNGTRTLYQASSGPLPTAGGARFFIFNRKTEAGVIAQARPDGSYVASPIDGVLGDPIEVYYQTIRGEVSPEICRKLAVGLAAEPCD